MHLIFSLDSSLGLVLASHMIPSSYLIFQGVPDTLTSGKTDRKKLRSIAQAIPTDAKLKFSLDASGSGQPPVTDMEFKLRDIWAKVLHLPTEKIGRADNFLRLGVTRCLSSDSSPWPVPRASS